MTPFDCNRNCEFCIAYACEERRYNTGAYTSTDTLSITAEESRLIEKELEYKDIIDHLKKAAIVVGFDKNIGDAINELSKQTRFTDDTEDAFKKSVGRRWKNENLASF